MGIIGSKEKVNQLVTIYGYQLDDIPWLDFDSRKIYQTNGIVVSNGTKSYVLTTRNNILGCKILTAYYCHFHKNKEYIFKNDLEVIFHSIEFNLVVLVSKDKNFFDFNAGHMLTGDIWSQFDFQSYDLLGKNSVAIPTKRNVNHLVKMDLDMKSHNVDYAMSIHNMKLVGTKFTKDSIAPNSIFYQFAMDEENQYTLNGIHGTVIFNKQNKLIGMVNKIVSSEGILQVIPSKVIYKFFSEFIQGLSKPTDYAGLASIPFEFDNEFGLTKNMQLDSGDKKKKMFKKEDQLLMINDNHIITMQSNERTSHDMFILDIVLKENIPLDLWIRLNTSLNEKVNVTIRRKNKTQKIDVYPESSLKNVFPLTTVPSYYPNKLIPYINESGLIIAELSHELLSIFYKRGIKLQNSIIESLFDDTLKDFNHLLILDCTNEKLAEQLEIYNLSKIFKKQINPQSKIEIYVNILTSINNHSVTSLKEAQSILHQITYPVYISAGLSYDNQFIYQI
jgi:hypothetical protein